MSSIFVNTLVCAVCAVVLAGCHADIDPPALHCVTGGVFEMGDPFDEGGDDEQPEHLVGLSPYWIGDTEVTNAQYAEVLNWAGDRGLLEATPQGVFHNEQLLLETSDPDCQIACIYDRYEPVVRDGFSMADHPVVEVSWYGAVAYCNWLSQATGLSPVYDLDAWALRPLSSGGYRLPTEAEWEFAAAWAPVQERHWRYGISSDNITRDAAQGDFACNFSDHNPLELTTEPLTTPVGYYAGKRSPAGCRDMCGNVWEWIHDWYAADYYEQVSTSANNPTGPDEGVERCMRGGSWANDAGYCRTAYRGANPPDDTAWSVGFRVAR